MSYAHLSHAEREVISQMRYAGHSLQEIGDELGRSKGTISRELSRNRSGTTSVLYSAHRATALARCRRRDANRSRPSKLCRGGLLSYVKRRLRREWSPEQIAGRLKHERGEDLSRTISHTAIYRWLRKQKREGGEYHRFLRQSHRQRRSRYGSKTKRFQRAGRVSIDERPQIVERRSRIGDWEGDLMEGKNRTSYLLTLVDRRSGYLLVDKVCSKESAVVRDASVTQLRKMKREHRRTITFDNGTEFSGFHAIAKRTGAKIYFAHAYSSWERGTNENTNGLLRQYVPKSADIRVLSGTKLAGLARRLNNRPRKRLNYQTPSEVLRNKR